MCYRKLGLYKDCYYLCRTIITLLLCEQLIHQKPFIDRVLRLDFNIQKINIQEIN